MIWAGGYDPAALHPPRRPADRAGPPAVAGRSVLVGLLPAFVAPLPVGRTVRAASAALGAPPCPDVDPRTKEPAQ